MSLLGRIGQIARAEIENRIDGRFKKYLKKPSFRFETETPEEPLKNDPFPHAGFPKQVVDDLSVFGLKPPAAWDDIRVARNREIKKYHADKFQNDPERLKIATQIMQIVNTAFERLEVYYEHHPEADLTK